MATGSSSYEFRPPEPHGSAPAGHPPAVPPQAPPQMPPPKLIKTGPIMRLRTGGFLVLFGVLLFFIGTILLQSAFLLEEPVRDDFEDEDDPNKEFEDADEAYEDKGRNLVGSGRILGWVGTMLITLPLYAIGITSDQLEWKIRSGMIFAASALIIATMYLVTKIIVFS